MSETGAEIREASVSARFLLQGDDAALRVVATRFGLPLACAINRAEGSSAARAALRLGPEEWLLVAAAEEPQALEGESALAAGDFSLVDVSDRQVGFTIEGRDAALALNAGVPLDLSEKSFPAGAATRTIFEKTEIILWRTEPRTFRIEVARSFAPYLRALLELARRQIAAAP